MELVISSSQSDGSTAARGNLYLSQSTINRPSASSAELAANSHLRSKHYAFRRNLLSSSHRLIHFVLGAVVMVPFNIARSRRRNDRCEFSGVMAQTPQGAFGELSRWSGFAER